MNTPSTNPTVPAAVGAAKPLVNPSAHPEAQHHPTPPTPVPQATLPNQEASKGVATHPTQIASPVSGPAATPTPGRTGVASTGASPIPGNWKALAEKKIEDTLAFYNKFAGKVGCNPYFYVHKHIEPLQKELSSFDSKFEFFGEDGKEVTKEVYIDSLWNRVHNLEMKEAYAIHDKTAKQQEEERLEGILADKKAGRTKTIIQ